MVVKLMGYIMLGGGSGRLANQSHGRVSVDGAKSGLIGSKNRISSALSRVTTEESWVKRKEKFGPFQGPQQEKSDQEEVLVMFVERTFLPLFEGVNKRLL
jgi:hypothetical protein